MFGAWTKEKRIQNACNLILSEALDAKKVKKITELQGRQIAEAMIIMLELIKPPSE
jgi:hypothetical protein